VTASIVGSEETFLSADASDNGLRVSSAEPASARYSLFRERANLKSVARRYPIIAS